jgi:hypothetical protein
MQEPGPPGPLTDGNAIRTFPLSAAQRGRFRRGRESVSSPWPGFVVEFRGGRAVTAF